LSVFRVQISVGDTERRQWRELSAVVDTGTFMSAVPGSVLRDLGVVPAMNETGLLADGTEKNVDVAYTWLRMNGRQVMTHIIYNEEYTDPLLGSLALETLLYIVDPAGERLIPRSRFPF
jgi:predicted aspartyl protease